MRKMFAYVGTWPVLLRDPVPGLEKLSAQREDAEKTGIFGFAVDPKNGNWEAIYFFHTPFITSELALSSDGKFLYSNDEERNRNGIPCAGGSILSFRVNRETGALSLIDEQPSLGTSPTGVSIDFKDSYLFAANLGNPHEKYAVLTQTASGDFQMVAVSESGSLSMFHIQEDGKTSSAVYALGMSPDSIIKPAHYHCVKVDPSNRFVLATDMNDRIWVYRIDREANQLVPAAEPYFQTHEGVEPRTIQFHPKRSCFFVNNQRNSTVYFFEFNPVTGEITELDYVSTITNRDNAFKSWTSAMSVTPNGKWLYVTNRSMQKLMPELNCPPSSISVFKIDTTNNKLILQEEMVFPGENPRGMSVDPTGAYLYVTSTDTNEIYRYSIENSNGTLTKPTIVANVPVPSSIVFLNA